MIGEEIQKAREEREGIEVIYVDVEGEFKVVWNGKV